VYSIFEAVNLFIIFLKNNLIVLKITIENKNRNLGLIVLENSSLKTLINRQKAYYTTNCKYSFTI